MATAQGLQPTLADINTPDVSRACHAAPVCFTNNLKGNDPTIRMGNKSIFYLKFTLKKDTIQELYEFVFSSVKRWINKPVTLCQNG